MLLKKDGTREEETVYWRLVYNFRRGEDFSRNGFDLPSDLSFREEDSLDLARFRDDPGKT